MKVVFFKLLDDKRLDCSIYYLVSCTFYIMKFCVSSTAHCPWKQLGLNILIIFAFISALRTDNSYGECLKIVVYRNVSRIEQRNVVTHAMNIIIYIYTYMSRNFNI